MSIHKRIKEIRQSHQLTGEEFAANLKIEKSLYESIEAGDASISVDKLLELSGIFGINSQWLIYGIQKEEDYPHVTKRNAYMPLIDKDAVAGYLKNDGDQEYLKSLEFYKIPGFQEGEHCIFMVHGDSMLPTVKEKDQLVCTRSQSIDDLEENEMIVVVTEENVVVKRVGFMNEQREQLLLKSDNPEYKIYPVALSDVREIWKVKAKITHSLEIATRESDLRIEMVEKELAELKKAFAELLHDLKDGQDRQ